MRGAARSVKKNLLRFLGFSVIFASLFVLLGEAYTFHGDEAEKLRQFYNEPKDSIDVLLFGSSDILAAVVPPVLWGEAGVVSYNLGKELNFCFMQYFWLVEALRYQSPSLVILNGRYVYMQDGNIDAYEQFVWQTLDPMRMSRHKLESIRDVAARGKKQALLYYLFPLLRYHNRDGLQMSDFHFAGAKQRHPLMGGLYHNDRYMESMPLERPGGFDDEDRCVDVARNTEYLTKMVALCKERGIDVLLLAAPTYCDWWAWSPGAHQAMQDYADEHGIGLLDFNTLELQHAISWDDGIDFYNEDHTSIGGGTKITRYLAQYIAQRYAIPDRRAGGYDLFYDVALENYREMYNRYLEQL